MKFDCGKRSRSLRRELRIRARKWWHPWYAWYPVRIGKHDCRWLELVWRKGKYQHDWDGGGWWFWRYK